MIFEFWQQWCWRLWSAERWCVRWVCHIVFEDSIAFFYMQSFIMNWFTPFWISELPLGQHKIFASSPFHSSDLIKFPPPFLSKLQIHTSHLLLHPPELGSVTLNTEAVHFSDMSERILLGCVKPKNDHYVSCDLVSAKNISLCRMYWLDKSVRVVAIMLLLWFGYHSMLLQSTLSGIFTSSVFVWCFQTRCALHCSTLRSDLLKTWEFHTIDVST